MLYIDTPTSAATILDKFWNNSIPVNPITIAESLGIEVYKNETLTDIDGAFLVNDGIPTIIYRPTGNRRRDKFTIAHEIGHYCLQHGPRHRDSPKNFFANNLTPIERAANKFAGELLMPKNAVDYAVKISNISTVNEMSEYFDVSNSAMRIRLQQMGYLG